VSVAARIKKIAFRSIVNDLGVGRRGRRYRQHHECAREHEQDAGQHAEITFALPVTKEESELLRIWVETPFDKECLARSVNDASPLRLCEDTPRKILLRCRAVAIHLTFDRGCIKRDYFSSVVERVA
jgi:hypothetical protein